MISSGLFCSEPQRLRQKSGNDTCCCNYCVADCPFAHLRALGGPSCGVDEGQGRGYYYGSELVASEYEQLVDVWSSCALPAPLAVAAVAASSSWFDTHERLHTSANCGRNKEDATYQKQKLGRMT